MGKSTKSGDERRVPTPDNDTDAGPLETGLDIFRADRTVPIGIPSEAGPGDSDPPIAPRR